MKLTALEIRKHEFARSFRGYDPEEVEAFLNMVAQHWQTMSQDLRRMEDRLEEQTQRVNHYLKVEEALEHALENAKNMSAERLEAAEKEAGETLRDAEERARETIEGADQHANTTTQESEARATKLVRDAEAESQEMIRAAKAEAHEMLRAAKAEVEETRRDSVREFGDITRRTEAVRAAAAEEFQALDSQRIKILDDLRALLESSIASLSNYSTDDPGSFLEAFSREAPAESLPEPPSEAAQPTEPDPVRQAESADDAEAEWEDPLPESPVKPERTESKGESEIVSWESEPLPESDKGLADLPSGPDDTQPADNEQVRPEELLASLPSADESFEESAPELPESDEVAEFGAEDEIKKIRRILEDLDN